MTLTKNFLAQVGDFAPLAALRGFVKLSVPAMAVAAFLAAGSSAQAAPNGDSGIQNARGGTAGSSQMLLVAAPVSSLAGFGVVALLMVAHARSVMRKKPLAD
jgi:hypothetical protein